MPLKTKKSLCGVPIISMCPGILEHLSTKAPMTLIVCRLIVFNRYIIYHVKLYIFMEY